MKIGTEDVREFLGKVGDTLADAGKSVAETTKTMVDVAPLVAKQHEKERDLEKKYKELGKKYYEYVLSKDSNTAEEAFEENAEFVEVEAITALKEDICDLKKEIADKKGMKICDNCGETIDKNVSFCPHCGNKA